MKYNLQTSMAHTGNYGKRRTADEIKYLVIHYTGNDGDTAAGNANYYTSTIIKACGECEVRRNDQWSMT